MNISYIKTPEAIRIEQLTGIDFTPVRATEHSIGYDLKACFEEDLILFPNEVVKIPTGIQLDLLTLSIEHLNTDARFGAYIYPRSGLGTRGFVLANTVGVIDTDYQGEIIIMGYNRSDDTIHLKAGERIAQLVIQIVALPEFTQGGFSTTTERGEGGFGSTGA